jgi:hypothetical protein
VKRNCNLWRWPDDADISCTYIKMDVQRLLHVISGTFSPVEERNIVRTVIRLNWMHGWILEFTL